jgi:hypothetical protein
VADQLPDNQEDREVCLREHNAGRFVVAVNKTREEADTIVMTVKAFAGEPAALYVALDYAYHSGVAVTMAPGDSFSNLRCAVADTLLADLPCCTFSGLPTDRLHEILDQSL